MFAVPFSVTAPPKRKAERADFARGEKKAWTQFAVLFSVTAPPKRKAERADFARGKKRPVRKPRHNKVDTFYSFACRATVCRVLEPVGPHIREGPGLEGGALYNAGPPGT